MKCLGIDFNSIRMRITIGLLAAGALVVFVTAFSGFVIFEKTLVGEIGTNRSDVLSQIGDRVRQVKNSTYMVSNLYYYDERLRLQMEELAAGGGNEEALTSYMDGLTGQYKQSLYSGEMDYDVHLVLDNGWSYHSNREEGGRMMNPKNKIWYKDMLVAQGEIVDVANYQEGKSSNKSYFCAARAIFQEDGDPLAYLIISVDERDIYNMYYRVVSGGGILYIVDGEGTIVSSSNQKINGFQFFNMRNLNELFHEQDYTITQMRGDDILFTRYADDSSGFTVLEEIQLDALLAPIKRVRLYIIFAALATVAAVAACAYMLAGYFTRPLSRLCDFIQQIDEDRLEEKCQVTGYTEINILSEKVNFLLVKIQMLLEGSRQKEQQKRRMELGFLQAQIRPHFMYNTLFSIKCAVDMGRKDEAGHMLTTFIQLLRGVLSGPDEMMTIRSQMESIRQYVELQRFRYDGAFDALIECDEQAADCLIPKLLIQPLVENAILHGVNMEDGSGMITVIARRQGDTVAVQVEDNGKGMTQERIREVMNAAEDADSSHLGVRNIHDRIRLHFGEEWGLHIESTPGQGTQITLRFPARD